MYSFDVHAAGEHWVWSFWPHQMLIPHIRSARWIKCCTWLSFLWWNRFECISGQPALTLNKGYIEIKYIRAPFWQESVSTCPTLRNFILKACKRWTDALQICFWLREHHFSSVSSDTLEYIWPWATQKFLHVTQVIEMYTHRIINLSYWTTFTLTRERMLTRNQSSHGQQTEPHPRREKHFYSHAVSTIACRVGSLLIVLAILHIFYNLEKKRQEYVKIIPPL